MGKQDLLLKPEEVSDARVGHPIDWGTVCEPVLLREVLQRDFDKIKPILEAQLAHAEPIIRKQERERIIKEIEEKGIWAQVPFKVKESEETMWCLFEKDWQTLKGGEQ